MARYALRKRVLSTDYTDFTKTGLRLFDAGRARSRDCLLNLCNLWMTACSQPAPDRVEHDDHGGDHDDHGEACVNEALNRSLRLLRERPEDVCDRFETCDERRCAHKRERQQRDPRILRAS